MLSGSVLTDSSVTHHRVKWIAPFGDVFHRADKCCVVALDAGRIIGPHVRVAARRAERDAGGDGSHHPRPKDAISSDFARPARMR